MNYGEQLKFLKVGDEVIVEPRGQEKTFRTYVYGSLSKLLGAKFKITKVYKVKRLK